MPPAWRQVNSTVTWREFGVADRDRSGSILLPDEFRKKSGCSLALIFRYYWLDYLTGQQHGDSESNGVRLMLTAKSHEIEVAIPMGVKRKVDATNHKILRVLPDC